MTYFDEGKAKSKSLAARIKHLKDALTELSPGPGADARKAKLLKLEKEYDDFRVTEPQGPYFTWELSRVEQSLRSDTKSEVLLNKFNRSLCDVRNRLEKDLDCGRAVPIQDNFLGNQACIACHGAAFKVWQGTEHAQAWATLENKGKECDVGCVACHSVGFQKPGGFCRLMDKAPFVNVGCENCHGPGAGHAENPGDRTLWSKRFVAKPTADVCRECHNQTHSDEFNFDTYLPRILGPGHGAQP